MFELVLKKKGYTEGLGVLKKGFRSAPRNQTIANLIARFCITLSDRDLEREDSAPLAGSRAGTLNCKCERCGIGTSFTVFP